MINEMSDMNKPYIRYDEIFFFKKEISTENAIYLSNLIAPSIYPRMESHTFGSRGYSAFGSSHANDSDLGNEEAPIILRTKIRGHGTRVQRSFSLQPNSTLIDIVCARRTALLVSLTS